MHTANKIGFWIDHGSMSGMGHIARCRGLIEYLAQESDLPIEIHGGDEEFPRHLNWLKHPNIRQIPNTQFSNIKTRALIIDSYNKEIRSLAAAKKYAKVVLVSDNLELLPSVSSNVFHIVLEQFNLEPYQQRFSRNIARAIYGTIVWNSQIDYVYSKRTNMNKGTDRQIKILISLGGSSKVLESIKTICSIFKESQFSEMLNVKVFANPYVIRELLRYQEEKTYITYEAFGENYYSELVSTDLLIIGSGTSAIEAYHLGIPSIIFSLFENAANNFHSLQEIFSQSVFLRNPGRLTSETLDNLLKKIQREDFIINPTKLGSIGLNQKNEILNYIFDN